jgi:NH3-dependent NAD+ synthetase
MPDSDPIPLELRSRDVFTAWMRRITEKVLLPLLVLGIASVIASALATWIAVQRLTDKMQLQDAKLSSLEAELSSAKSQMVTQAQMLETLKRVEQQLEITMLRSRITPPASR